MQLCPQACPLFCQTVMIPPLPWIPAVAPVCFPPRCSAERKSWPPYPPLLSFSYLSPLWLRGTSHVPQLGGARGAAGKELHPPGPQLCGRHQHAAAPQPVLHHRSFLQAFKGDDSLCLPFTDFSEVHDDRDPENRYPSGTDPAAGSTEEKLLNVSIERTPLPCGYSAPPVPTKIPRQGKIRTIRCRKKVTFNSCVLLEMPHDGLATPPANQGTGNPGVNCDGIVAREDVKNLTLTPAFPTTPEQAKFFDFADKEERDAFFQRLCQRFSFEFPLKLIT
ncbi:uncharacterized protein [Osmerus mordax]|uniref:uncharacterized protein isoform X3 n=1 Tax=Osmerus mordax TaxID=8014 RepID=UPI003510A0A6